MKVGLFNTAFVGDLVLMARLVDALHLAGHEIILFSNKPGCLIYSFDKRISRSVVVEKKGGIRKVGAIVSIAQQIRNENLDVLFLAHRSITSRLIAALSRQAKVISFSRSSVFRFFSEQPNSTQNQHESERYLELAKGFVDESLLQGSRLTLHGDVSLRNFTAKNPNFFDKTESPFFVCSPGSVWETKRYPPKLMARVVARLLLERTSMRCVLSGGPTDSDVIGDVLEELQSGAGLSPVLERVFDARSCLPLAELIELTKRALFVLTPDSAPLHVASAAGVKAFAFFGPTASDTGFGPLSEGSQVLDYRRFRGISLECQPCSKHGQRQCPVKHHKCLSDLPPDAITADILNYISDRARPAQ